MLHSMADTHASPLRQKFNPPRPFAPAALPKTPNHYNQHPANLGAYPAENAAIISLEALVLLYIVCRLGSDAVPPGGPPRPFRHPQCRMQASFSLGRPLGGGGGCPTHPATQPGMGLPRGPTQGFGFQWAFPPEYPVLRAETHTPALFPPLQALGYPLGAR